MEAGRLDPEHELAVQQSLELFSARRQPPRATYRLQFHANFTFGDAAAIVPYLARLGVSHVYASPLLQAKSGSPHGYDVCSYGHLNLELGGELGFQEFARVLCAHDMGLVADIVPNHMSASTQNAWWRDVLENGPNSPFAQFFDIDWHPLKDELANRVLLPILGGQYGQVLENGELRIEHRDGGFHLRYFDNVLPLGPKTALPILTDNMSDLAALIGPRSDEFIEYQSILTALENLPSQTATSFHDVVVRQREKEVIKRRIRDLELRCPALREHIEKSLSVVNGQPKVAESFNRLDDILTAQPYRLCHWRVAADEINYRRFFDINELAAVCMENPLVFFHAHRCIIQLAARGLISGLRIDHVDGLFAPEEYLWRLQWMYMAETVRWRMTTNAVACHMTPQAEFDLALSTISELTDGAAASFIDISREVDVAESAAVAACVRTLCLRMGLPYPSAQDWPAVVGGAWDAPQAPSEERMEAASPLTPRFRGAVPLYVVVEKILGPDEPLPESWPVAGTSGYDFLTHANGLTVSPEGWKQLCRDYARWVPEYGAYRQVAIDAKRLILRTAMSSELQMLAHRLNRISERQRRTRDFTLNLLRTSLREVLVYFPVYRVYPQHGCVSDRDRCFVRHAVAMAKRRNQTSDTDAFDFIQDVLTMAHPEGATDEVILERELFTGRFQQVTSPVMAKGVEDTAFYVYVPLASVNDVGAEPGAPTVSVADFHQLAIERHQEWPHAMLATTTHDTKRTEDVRARLNVLSEMPGQWRAAVHRWSRLNRRWRVDIEGSAAPSRNDEYLFYQSLLGIWPLEPPGAEEHAELVRRLQQYMEKATREAKQYTSWIRPDHRYDDALREFVAHVLKPAGSNRFLQAFREFQQQIVTYGLCNSLCQLALKLTLPGCPDIYQGQEQWDFSLVDPDNRRPVDYGARLNALEQFCEIGDHEQSPDQFAESLSNQLSSPLCKHFVTWRLLDLRRKWPALLSDGEFEPLAVHGPASAHVLAFARMAPERSDRAVLVVISRFLATLDNASVATDELSGCAHRWRDTALDCGRFADWNYSCAVSGNCGRLSPLSSIAELLPSWPMCVAVLESGE
ncbi:MAG: malto-oligosyltrehalose synthase [Planctomycetia bacterium]|nr:malto-oligosyltrehalose synthase [Planctomycetia bacterium]